MGPSPRLCDFARSVKSQVWTNLKNTDDILIVKSRNPQSALYFHFKKKFCFHQTWGVGRLNRCLTLFSSIVSRFQYSLFITYQEIAVVLLIFQV